MLTKATFWRRFQLAGASVAIQWRNVSRTGEKSAVFYVCLFKADLVDGSRDKRKNESRCLLKWCDVCACVRARACAHAYVRTFVCMYVSVCVCALVCV